MSDEIKTAEQARADHIGKIELPEPVTLASEIAAGVPTSINELMAKVVEAEPIDAVAEHVKGIQTIAEIVEAAKPNKLGTQDFCPMKDKCNHKGAEYCKQAKLEADHRRECSKGYQCDCFSPKRGIPTVFRFGNNSNDGRIG